MLPVLAALPSVLSLGLAWAQPEPWPPLLPPPDPPPEINAQPAVAPAPAPPTPPPARPPAPPQPFPTYILRLHLGLGWIMPSDQSGMLRKDGFDMGPRVQAMADMTLVLDKWFGVGAWGGVAAGGWHGDYGGIPRYASSRGQPTLFQQVYYVGGQVPFYLKSERPMIALTPRVGMATGRLFVHGAGTYRSTWTAGLELSFMTRLPRGVLLGASLGALWAPVAGTPDSPLHYDMGGFMLSFLGGYGG